MGCEKLHSNKRIMLRVKEVIVTMTEIYCVKCKTKRDAKDPQQITMKNGRPAVKGKCPVCGTAMFKIGSK